MKVELGRYYMTVDGAVYPMTKRDDVGFFFTGTLQRWNEDGDLINKSYYYNGDGECLIKEVEVKDAILIAHEDMWNKKARADLRERAAIAAMQGLLSNEKLGDRDPSNIASWAVEQADAMITEMFDDE